MQSDRAAAALAIAAAGSCAPYPRVLVASGDRHPAREPTMSAPNSNAMPASLRAAIVPVTPFQQNCTLLWNESTKAGCVVDPGGDVPRILAAIKQVGMTVEKILLTHGHLDHVGGAMELKVALGNVPVEGPHQADEVIMQNVEKQAATYGVPGTMNNATSDRWLIEGDTVTVAGHTFEILHCPGHSPGSVVYFNRAQRFALMGDVLFQGSVGRTDIPGGSHDQLISSIKNKILPLGDDVTFVCGHGPTSTIGAERESNPFID
jgi:glyoxylase-like metal-dependent hydrolase (beta-lactamase superfamily II)